MLNRKDWITNIENAATEVSKLLGWDTVRQVLRKYGARSIDDLSPVNYCEVFNELDFMATDARD